MKAGLFWWAAFEPTASLKRTSKFRRRFRSISVILRTALVLQWEDLGGPEGPCSHCRSPQASSVFFCPSPDRFLHFSSSFYFLPLVSGGLITGGRLCGGGGRQTGISVTLEEKPSDSGLNNDESPWAELQAEPRAAARDKIWMDLQEQHICRSVIIRRAILTKWDVVGGSFHSEETFWDSAHESTSTHYSQRTPESSSFMKWLEWIIPDRPPVRMGGNDQS